ncbi:phospholipase D-like domain-containing protein [Scytonema sp. NUACC26]|uniref:phospholipase D-like domain-containing protein n=1 Tax=Scytonema sp. NUACC26 TaxID=3140176 RepID=UPI0034DC35BF
MIPENHQIASIFTEEFNYMWQGLFKSYKPKRSPIVIPVGHGTIAINFSPNRKKDNIATTSNGIIASYMQQAQKSVHIAVFVYSDQKISDTLGNVRDRGVEDIKVLIDPDFFRQPYSKAYDAMGVCPQPSKSSPFIKVKPWNQPIMTVGFPTAPMGDRGVHSKMAVLDGVLAIAGSHNWSNSGNYMNDETLVFINNPIVAAHYEREFNRLYEIAELGLKTLPSARKCRVNS